MASQILEVIAGTDQSWTHTLIESDGFTPCGYYPSSATFSITLWAGEDQPVISPGLTAAWLDPSQGTYRLTSPAATTVSLTPEIYHVIVEITYLGATRPAFKGRLKVIGGPGTATALSSYCTLRDMKRLFASIESLADPDSGEAGFGEQRFQARQWLETIAQRHYRGGLGFDQSRFLYYGDGFWRTGRRNVWLQEQFDANFLLVTDDVKRACAMYAIHLVLGSQVEKDGNGFYQKQAARFGIRADAQAAMLTLELDTNGDGVGDVTIGLGSVDVLRG